MNSLPLGSKSTRIAVDIGSTMVKIAQINGLGEICSQEHYPRDFQAGIAKQVESLLTRCGVPLEREDILVCSSANGGLRVGIIALTKHYSGAALRNQALLAGANPVFIHGLEDQVGEQAYVDILLVGGGIDCEDAPLLEQAVRGFQLKYYQFGSLVYAGNRCIADQFVELYPTATVVPNPLADGLAARNLSVFEAIRRAYLDDLVYKEGVSELRANLSKGIRPTPEIVNQGFQRALANSASIHVVGPCLVLDIGGATTDLHYTVEIVRDDSAARPSPGISVARYVFTDLGIVASRDSLMLQLRSHPRLYQFLKSVLDDDPEEVYRGMREGEYAESALLLSYGCLFIALDRFAQGAGPGLPTADLTRLEQIILTGGASQTLSEIAVGRVFQLFGSQSTVDPEIFIDRRYQLWVDGITWSGRVSI
jgi:hypothetical protein